MLTHLHIQNYALINELDISLQKGLTTITGETGAGKSILLGALSLILGQRADTQVLQDKNKKCIIEATFSVAHYNLQEFFTTNELDYLDHTIIRREISNTGTSRAFINDTPVTLNLLKEIGLYLIDIHSQHQTLQLNNALFQLSIVDAKANTAEIVKTYRQQFRTYQQLTKQLQSLQDENERLRKEQDYIQFQFNELDAAGLIANEQELLEKELDFLNNAEGIKSAFTNSLQLLSEAEINILQQLNEVKLLLVPFAKTNEEINQLTDRINSSYIELKDISKEIEHVNDNVHFDAERIELISSKLDAIYRLQKKHNVTTVEELIAIKETFEQQLVAITSNDEAVTKLHKLIEDQYKQTLTTAKNISKQRVATFESIEKYILQQLTQLGMENAQFKIQHEVLTDLDENGIDKVKFIFNANKGGELKELHKVASGGELSRLMLSIKSMIATSTQLPTIIFDEIDTGVSGDVAYKMGAIMKEMANDMQVLVITHLPQIASKGADHFFVYKDNSEEKTISHIKLLTREERIIEIAKMLSNSNPSESAIKNATDLLTVDQ